MDSDEDNLSPSYTDVSWQLSDPSVLRGTHLATVLSCGGRQLRTSPDKVAGDEDLANRIFSESFVVDRLSFFLSHSWHAPWHQKYISLLFYFNGIAAVSASIAVTAIYVGLNTAYAGRLASDYPCLSRWGVFALSFFAFLAILLYFQHLLAAIGICSSPFFFDKVCIHQSDPELKARGIRSIGGILRWTDTLVVAWDSSYFQRLWCPFEIAAFKATHPDGKIIVLLVEFGNVLIFGVVAGIVKATAVALVYDISGGWLSPEQTRLLQYATLIPPYLLAAYAQGLHAANLGKLQSQAEKYSISQADCFCCKHGHVHPETHEVLPCDRALVCQSISQWYGAGDQQEGQLKFDKMVRKLCQGTITDKLGDCGMQYRNVLTFSVWRSIMSYVDDLTNPNPPSFGWEVFWSADLLFLREPMCFALVFFLSRCFLARSSTIRACGILIVTIGVLGVQIGCYEVAIRLSCHLESSGSDATAFDMHCVGWPKLLPWMCLEAVVVWFFYFRSTTRSGQRHSISRRRFKSDAAEESTDSSSSSTGSVHASND